MHLCGSQAQICYARLCLFCQIFFFNDKWWTNWSEIQNVSLQSDDILCKVENFEKKKKIWQSTFKINCIIFSPVEMRIMRCKAVCIFVALLWTYLLGKFPKHRCFGIVCPRVAGIWQIYLWITKKVRNLIENKIENKKVPRKTKINKRLLHYLCTILQT